jgi:subtilisin family serine protease
MRYVMANRRAGKFGREEKVLARASLMATLHSLQTAKVLADLDPEDQEARRVIVFEAEPGELEDKRRSFSPDAMVEPEILYYTGAGWSTHTRPSHFASATLFPSSGSAGVAMPIAVHGAGQPIPDASVTLYTVGPGGAQRAHTAKTDGQGNASFPLDVGFQPAAAVAVPVNSFWDMVVWGPPASGVVIDCPPLPRGGPFGWWHHAVGIDSAGGGDGIKVGVIDTGCGPNQNLAHAALVGAFLDGNRISGAGAARDVEGHGSHTAGIIGARPSGGGDYAGLAPNAELFVARVFKPGEGANQGDIANAIDALSREMECDLLNLSLGSSQRSDILEDAIRDALERGTLCICAAGNDAGAVNYPAAYKDCVAVSAIGLAGWGPPGSLSASRLPDKREFYGEYNYYLANFSCIGPQLTCAAPGVGIISTVPDQSGRLAVYAAMDGTSMASPAACGVLAALLSRNPAYAALPRDDSRANAARAVLARSCRPIGLVTEYEGRGIPFAAAGVGVV